MVTKRIISFLPSATELIYELGAQNQLFGVTHECRFPKDATSKPHVIESVFEPKKMSSKQIDKKVNDLISNGKPIYKIQEVNLKKANPDLIISQEICDVCSAATNEVNDAISILGKKPELTLQGFGECSDRPESVRNRKYTKFLIDMICQIIFQLSQKMFFSIDHCRFFFEKKLKFYKGKFPNCKGKISM